MSEKALCECGHPDESHPASFRPGRDYYVQHPCRATVYQNVPGGMNAWPCSCQRFKEAK